MFESFYRSLPGRVRAEIEKMIKRRDGGEFFSRRLRRIYKQCYNVEVGKGSYGCFNVEQFPVGTRVGNYCSIGPRVIYLYSNHPMSAASTHPLFYNKVLGYVREDRIERLRLIIGHDVWIGANTIITKGCTKIGNGSVIGAGSIVTHDVPAYSIMAGNPARLLRMRFPQEVQDALEACEWFDLEPDALAQCIDCVDDPLAFVKKVNELKERTANR